MDAPVPLIAAALLAAGALVAPQPRWRAAAMLAALVLAPAILLAHVWDTEQLRALRDDPAAAFAAAAALAAAVGGLAVLCARRPEALPVAAVVALPFRIPLDVDGAGVPLLLPLYAVVAAGALAYAVPRLRGDVEERAPGPLEWLVAAAVVAYAAQAPAAAHLDPALEHVVFAQVPFAILFGLLARTAWTARMAAQVLAVAAAVAVVLAGIGIAERGAGRLLITSEVVASHRADSSLRVGSVFYDPDLFGRWLAVMMVGLAAVLVWARRGRDVALAGAAIVVLWGGLVVTLSRPSFAALLVGLVVLAVLRAPGRAAALAGVLVLAAGAGIAVVSASGAADRRWDVVQDDIAVFGDHVASGLGSGSVPSAARIEPVAVAAEQGVLGLVLYVALLGVAFAYLLRGARGDPVRVALAAAFAAVAVHAWGAGAFLEDPAAWVVLGGGAALAPALGRVQLPRRVSRSSTPTTSKPSRA